jgi:hypothetical protein
VVGVKSEGGELEGEVGKEGSGDESFIAIGPKNKENKISPNYIKRSILNIYLVKIRHKEQCHVEHQHLSPEHKYWGTRM